MLNGVSVIARSRIQHSTFNPHPRDLSSARYLALRDEIFCEIGLAHRI
jgi:hypothetical protein